MLLIGGLFWAFVIAEMTAIVSNLDPHVAEFRNTFDQLNHFLGDNTISKEHEGRLRTFFHQTQDFQRYEEQQALLGKMSTQLCADTAQLIGKKKFDRVWWLQCERWGFEANYISALALKFQQATSTTRRSATTFCTCT
eukprot:3893105-Prymnesium_polylepis.1